MSYLKSKTETRQSLDYPGMEVLQCLTAEFQHYSLFSESALGQLVGAVSFLPVVSEENGSVEH